jgi:hypothetical protein
MSQPARLGRVVEADVRDASLARWLRAQGSELYLGLAAPARLAALRAELPAWAAKFQPWIGPGQLASNDAQTLALAGDAALAVASRESFSHVERLLVPARWALAAPLAVRRLIGNLRFDGELELPGGRWRVCPVRRDTKIRPRMFLSPELGPRAFFARLNESGARYAVLRWWDELPEIAPGRDVDFLVHDEDLGRFEEALGELPGTIPLDVYTRSGVPGHDYRGACYYPPARADEILGRAVDSGRGVRVPAPREAFFSLAFHAVYHKGEAAGLPSELPGVRPSAAPAHDFAAILPALARPLGSRRRSRSRGWTTSWTGTAGALRATRCASGRGATPTSRHATSTATAGASSRARRSSCCAAARSSSGWSSPSNASSSGAASRSSRASSWTRSSARGWPRRRAAGIDSKASSAATAAGRRR